MNQIKDWDGHCQRCGEPVDVHIMSMFDVSLICMDCSSREQKHYAYEKARKADINAIRHGNNNFSGIGKPEDIDDY